MQASLAAKLAWFQYGVSPCLSSVQPLVPKFCTVCLPATSVCNTAGQLC